ncbi:hypothetical protein BSKO_09888 [Bryopsis sp. KO-2023]|nr:hypothetical protein BSKO_09888 [Bryopsis sp. KO-2023]
MKASQKLKGSTAVRHPSDEVLTIWREAQAVCFDVDSTLCEDESIDELAAFLGAGEKVAELTNRAMGGSMKFEEALKLRLDCMNPSQNDVDRFLVEHPPRLSKGIPELVKLIHGRGASIFLISGGFRQIINPIAEMLDIGLDQVFANTILFKEDGSYDGFDSNEFTSRSGGKPDAVKSIKEKYGYHPMVMIGDGATDLEAKKEGAVELFIGYGGVAERPSVAKEADWYVYDIQSLIDALRASS